MGDAEVEGCEGGMVLEAECCCCVGLRTVGEVGGTEGGRRSRPELLFLPLFIATTQLGNCRELPTRCSQEMLEW